MSKEVGILPFEDYKLPPIGHAISGAVGSTIANLFIYPLDMYVKPPLPSSSRTKTLYIIVQLLDFN